MPNTHTVTGFHHVAIRTTDFQRSLDFYTSVLGLEAKVAWGSAPDRAIMLGAGDAVYLEIFERKEQAAPPSEEGAILHFALRTDDTTALLERARVAGCPVTMEPKSLEINNTVAGAPSKIPVKIAFIKGPDGEVIEFFQNTLT